MLCAAPMFPCIMTMVPNYTIYFLSLTCSSLNYSLQIKPSFAFSYDFCRSFGNKFIFIKKLIISIVCSLKYSQNAFMKSLPLYTSCLFSMLLNADILDIKKSTFVYLLLL